MIVFYFKFENVFENQKYYVTLTGNVNLNIERKYFQK